jgi:hypothetical protein
MRFHVSIYCDNAAFDGAPHAEVARILGQLSERLKLSDDEAGKLRDINGNWAGSWSFDREG